MKGLLALSLCVLSAAAITMQSCKKIEHIIQHHVPDCRIEKMLLDDGPDDSAVFVYNHKGNPVSIIRTKTGTSIPNFFFRYDKRGRLTDLIGIYESGSTFDTWHRLYYDHRDRIILDSIYEFGSVGEVPAPTPDDVLRVRNVSTYKYDAYNRIIASTDTYGNPYVAAESKYIYNSEGNLAKIVTVREGYADSVLLSNYDDKINMHLTHPIWQYLDRDYSLNNSFTAAAYSSRGLPTLIETNKQYGSFAQIYYYGRLEIVYKCR